MKKDKKWLKEEVEGYLAIEGVYDARIALKAVLEYIKQMDEEPKLTVVPQFVADYLEESKGWNDDANCYEEDNSMSLISAFDLDASGLDRKLEEYLLKNSETVARAWLDDYTIEKEKQYLVLDKNSNVIIRKILGKIVRVFEDVKLNEYPDWNKENLQLTEQEIKDYDERFWAFAEEVCE